MKNKKQGKFESPWDFIVKFSGLFKGPYRVSETLDPVFQEKIRLAVTFANNCSF